MLHPVRAAGLLDLNPYRQVSVAGAAARTTETPHIRARAPGRPTPAYCPGPRAARIPAAAHSPGGCGLRGGAGGRQRTLPLWACKSRGELQPIVPACQSRTTAPGGQKGVGERGHGRDFLLRTWARPDPA